MLRRPHFKKLAVIIRSYKLRYPDIPFPFRSLASDVADMCQHDNPSFDRSKFMKECGYYDE